MISVRLASFGWLNRAQVNLDPGSKGLGYFLKEASGNVISNRRASPVRGSSACPPDSFRSNRVVSSPQCTSSSEGRPSDSLGESQGEGGPEGRQGFRPLREGSKGPAQPVNRCGPGREDGLQRFAVQAMVSPLYRFLVQGQCRPDARRGLVGEVVLLAQEVGDGGPHSGVLRRQGRSLWGVALRVLDRGAEGWIAAQGEGLDESEIALLGGLFGAEGAGPRACLAAKKGTRQAGERRYPSSMRSNNQPWSWRRSFSIE